MRQSVSAALLTAFVLVVVAFALYPSMARPHKANGPQLVDSLDLPAQAVSGLDRQERWWPEAATESTVGALFPCREKDHPSPSVGLASVDPQAVTPGAEVTFTAIIYNACETPVTIPWSFETVTTAAAKPRFAMFRLRLATEDPGMYAVGETYLYASAEQPRSMRTLHQWEYVKVRTRARIRQDEAASPLAAARPLKLRANLLYSGNYRDMGRPVSWFPSWDLQDGVTVTVVPGKAATSY